MSDQNRSEARTHLGRAGRQSRHAARNAAEAAKQVTTPVVNGAEHVAEEAVGKSKRLNPRGISILSFDTGIGFLALSASVSAGLIAYKQFRGVAQGRKVAIKPPEASP